MFTCLNSRAQGAQRRHGLRGEAALREIRRALHEQHHRARAELGLDSLDHVHRQPRYGLAAGLHGVERPRTGADSERRLHIHGKLAPLLQLGDHPPLLGGAHGRPAADLIGGSQAPHAVPLLIERADPGARGTGTIPLRRRVYFGHPGRLWGRGGNVQTIVKALDPGILPGRALLWAKSVVLAQSPATYGGAAHPDAEARPC